MPRKPVALIILDGFALRDETFGNAVAQSKKPNFDRYWETYPHATLTACGKRSVFRKVKWGTLK